MSKLKKQGILPHFILTWFIYAFLIFCSIDHFVENLQSIFWYNQWHYFSSKYNLFYILSAYKLIATICFSYLFKWSKIVFVCKYVWRLSENPYFYESLYWLISCFMLFLIMETISWPYTSIYIVYSWPYTPIYIVYSWPYTPIYCVYSWSYTWQYKHQYVAQ